MSTRELTRLIAVLGNGLVAASLFFVLIWWRVSAYLFLAGAAVYLLVWLVDGESPSTRSIAQE